LVGKKLEVEKTKYDKKIKIQDRESDKIGMIIFPMEMWFGKCCHHPHEAGSDALEGVAATSIPTLNSN